jgi:hypothetical protein
MNIGRIAAAAGFATGAALAFAPLASADTSSMDWASTIDSLLSGASPAPATGINLDISFDGYTIYDGGGDAHAYTLAGQYGLAIAYGDGATAYAEGGTGDYALASGTDANAEAGSLAPSATGNNFDTAVDIGNNGSNASTDNVGAYAGNGSLLEGGTDVGTDSNDSAYDFGNNSASESYSGAFAGYDSDGGSGNGDTAYDYGNNSAAGEYNGAFAAGGNNDYASDSGNNTAFNDGAFAGYNGNNDTAIADTNYSIANSYVSAQTGSGNYAFADGPDNSTAVAYDGSSNVAVVDDPFGAAGSPDSATAGIGFSNDLAEVLFTHGTATADTANLLYDIVSVFGPLSGSF